MPGGGAKPGERRGGRQKGTPNKRTLAQKEAVAAGGITPLEWMLGVLRDPKASLERRDFMAKSAAPYCHRALKSTEFTGADGGPVQVESEITITFD